MAKNSKQLQDTVAIIGIGATRISYGIVARLLQQDAIVVVPAQSSHHLRHLRQNMDDYHTGRLVTMLTDLPDHDKAADLAEMVLDEYGPLDMVVFPFDYPSISDSFSNISIEKWERTLQENLTVYLNYSRVAIGAMKKRGKGMFVAIIDTDSLARQPNNTLTGMLVDGQIKMALSFFEEVKNTGIKFYHLFINNLDAHTWHHEPGSKAITPELVGQYVLHLYNGDVRQRNSPFLFLMNKPYPDIHQYFTKI